MNQIIIDGNLADDPRLNSVNGQTVVSFRFGNHIMTKKADGSKTYDETEWYSASYWVPEKSKRDPQYWAKLLHKGTAVIVMGTKSIEEWVDKNGATQKTQAISVKEIIPTCYPKIETSSYTAPAAQTPPPPPSDNDGFPEDPPF